MRNRGGALLAVWALVLAAPAGTAEPRPDITSVDTSRFPLVTVTTVTDVPVPDLEAFTVTQDGAPRPIRRVTSADGPVQLALVIDTSRHMRDDLRAVIASAVELLLLDLPADTETSLVTAAGDVRVVVDRTPDVGAVIGALADVRASGDSALLEAIPLAVDQISRGSTGRRAVVIVAAAGDGDAAQVEEVEEVARLLRHNGVSLFGIALGDTLLDELARTAGGSVRRLDRIAEPLSGLGHVGDDLANLYQIDFTAYGGDIPTEIAVGIGQRPVPRSGVTVTLPEPDGDRTALPGSPTGDPSPATVWAVVAAVAVVAIVAGAAVTSWLVRRRHVAVTRLPSDSEAPE